MHANVATEATGPEAVGAATVGPAAGQNPVYRTWSFPQGPAGERPGPRVWGAGSWSWLLPTSRETWDESFNLSVSYFLLY